MLHVIRLIERRYPERAGRIVGVLGILSGSAVLLGVGLLLTSRT